MRVFFLTDEWTALERFVRKEVDFPEGMPSVYLPWLRYTKHGYDVHIIMVGNFKQPDIIDFRGCKIHLCPRPVFFQGKKFRFPLFQLQILIDQIVLFRTCVSIAGSSPVEILYNYQELYVYTGWLLARRYRSVFVKRLFGTWTYDKWHNKKKLKIKIDCLFDFLRWIWPCDLMIITHDGTHGDEIANLLRINKNKFRMWLNGVDKRESPHDMATIKSKLRLTDDDFILLCLSRLVSWKRQELVIQAMPFILKEVPNAKLVIIGDGPQREELEKNACDLGVQPHVRFIGMIGHDKVYELLSIADVFLQTNDVSCLGNTLLEALSCGRAIITRSDGATNDVITDGENGILLPNADPATIAREVIALARDNDRRQRLEQGARRYAQENLQTWDERLDMEIDLVEQIYASHKDRTGLN